LIGVLQGRHQKVEEFRPLVGEVPLGYGGDGVGHRGAHLEVAKTTLYVQQLFSYKAEI